MASNSRFRLSATDFPMPSTPIPIYPHFLSSNPALVSYNFTTTPYALNTPRAQTATPCPQVQQKRTSRCLMSFPPSTLKNLCAKNRNNHMGLDEAPQTNLQPSSMRYVMRTGRSENSFITRSKRRIRMGRT